MESLKTRKKLDYFHICRQIHTEISGNFAGTISVTVAKMAKQFLANWKSKIYLSAQISKAAINSMNSLRRIFSILLWIKSYFQMLHTNVFMRFLISHSATGTLFSHSHPPYTKALPVLIVCWWSESFPPVVP